MCKEGIFLKTKFLNHLLRIALSIKDVFVVHCAIWYHLYNFKNVKNTHGGVLILVKLQASSFIKSFPKTFNAFCSYLDFKIETICFTRNIYEKSSGVTSLYSFRQICYCPILSTFCKQTKSMNLIELLFKGDPWTSNVIRKKDITLYEHISYNWALSIPLEDIRNSEVFLKWVNPLNANPTKWSNTFKHLPTSCLSVFDHFLGLVLKGLTC